jgi:hypothetical protein
VALLLTSLHGWTQSASLLALAAEGPRCASPALTFERRSMPGELPQLGDTAELLVSELVTNAVRHATGPSSLQVLLLDEIVSFSVADAKTPCPAAPHDVRDEGGRGLQLVSLLSHRWGARATVSGKVVWCDLRRPQRA